MQTFSPQEWQSTKAFYQKILLILVVSGFSIFRPIQAAVVHGNALDRIDFGQAASEQAHQLEVDPTAPILLGVGALRQSYRAPVPVDGDTPKTATDHLAFTLKVDPAKQNYLSVRLWGGDQQTAGLFLQGTPRSYGAMDWNGTGGPPSFPNRFYYTTIPIPLEQTRGQTSVPLVLYEGNASVMLPGRPIYSAYTHSDPCFVPDRADATGVPMPMTGQKKPEILTAAQMAAFLQANRQSLYGPGGYYEMMLSRQIMPGTKSAPPEVVGLDLWTPVADWVNEPRSADDWRDQAGGHGHGGGYATMPDELLSVLTSTYLLKPFLDVDGKVVAGLDHFHDADLLTRIVAALDGSTYVQSSDGSFNEYGEDGAHGVSVEGHWQGLASTPRADGHPYAGSKQRGSGWTLTLEGADTATFGWVLLQLLDDPVAAPVFKKSLGQSFDANLDGKPILRVKAYQRMLNNQIAYQAKIFGGGTVSQAMMATNSIYTNLVALDKLEALYPYRQNFSTFPPETVRDPDPVAYPALTAAQGVDFIKQSVGVDPVTPIMGNLYSPVYENYAISKKGFGEAGGTHSGGYDGRYGVILPWMAARMAQIAAGDPAINAATLAKIRAQASAATDAYIRFVSPNEKFKGTTNEFTLAQEDFITYRDPYNANANGNTFTVGSHYAISNPASGMSTPLSRRAAWLEAFYGIPPRDLQYLRDLAAYEATLRGFGGVDPARMTALPGEPDQPVSAWVDPQTGATAVYLPGERFYLNAGWRNGDVAGNGNVSNLARIHDTTAAVDLTALVFMPHDAATVQTDGNLSGKLFEPWVVRFGKWLMMGNPGSTAARLRLPNMRGSAVELISRKLYALPGFLDVPPGGAAVLVLPSSANQSVVPGPARPLADGLYVLTSANSGLALAETITQETVVAETPAQQWQLTYQDGTYTMKNVADGTLLTDSDGLKLQPATLAADQLWTLVPDGIGYLLFNKATGLTTDVLYGYTDVGQAVITHGYSGSLNQIWHFTSAPPGKAILPKTKP